MRSLEDAVLLTESSDINHPDGNDNAIGDLGIPLHAYGPMQIRQPVCDDVNKAYGTNFQAKNMSGRRALSRAIFWLYMSLYATSTQLGRIPTDQDRARIWNGGPSGWKSDATLSYWQKVQSKMN